MNDNPADNRRQYRRSHVGGTATFNHAGKQLKARIENISLGGLYAPSDRRLPVGAEMMVDIPLRNGAAVVVRAEVVHSSFRGVGLRFHWTGEADQSRSLLQQELGV